MNETMKQYGEFVRVLHEIDDVEFAKFALNKLEETIKSGNEFNGFKSFFAKCVKEFYGIELE